jgi:anti-sigma B factor antagonist
MPADAGRHVITGPGSAEGRPLAHSPMVRVPMDRELFEMERRSSGRSTRVVLRGELDLAAALELQDFLAELNADTFDRVVVDLRELTFIDSTGMNFAYRLDRWGREAGRSLVFTRPVPDVLHTLEVAGLAQQFRFIEPDDDVA